MPRMWAIAVNTFREAVRDKVLYAVLALSAFVVAFTLFLAQLALDQQARVVEDVGLASISLFAVVISVFLGSSLLFKEMERKTLYVILPKPIGRREFLVGKYLGIVVTTWVFIATVGGLQCWLHMLIAGVPGWIAASAFVAGSTSLGFLLFRYPHQTLVWPMWSLLWFGVATAAGLASDASMAPLLWALALIAFETMLLVAVALFFSSFSTPFLTGGLTVGTWVVGRSADDMSDLRSDVLADAIEAVMHGLAHVIPNFHLFYPGHHLLSGAGVPAYFSYAAGYALLYAGFLLLIAAEIFQRRDLP